MEVAEGPDQKSDIKFHSVAAHVRLKNEFTVDKKCHNLITGLKQFLFVSRFICVCLRYFVRFVFDSLIAIC